MKIVLLRTEKPKPHRITEDHLEMIRSVDPTVTLAVVPPDEEEAFMKEVKEADAIAGLHRSSAHLMQYAKNVKWIHAFTAGVDSILTPEIVNSDIIVSNSSGIHATPIAEHVLGYMLLFTRRFPQTLSLQRQKKWEKQEDLAELYGKRVLIAGFGNIGAEIGRLAHAFGMAVDAIDSDTEKKIDYVDHIRSPEYLQDALGEADFVVSSVPYTPHTHHMFGKDQFEAMKKEAVFINIGRGGVADEQALIAALQSEKIGGAALDVFETEPLPLESPLWDMEHVVITPHHSGWSEKYMDRAIAVFCRNLRAFLDGKPLPNMVDKEKGY